MGIIVFSETSPAVNKADIAQIEESLGIVFPGDFILHYLQYNGGYPEADTYNCLNGETTTVNTFYSLKYEGFGKIEDTYVNLVLSEKYLPTGIVIFATDDGGNFFCLSVRENDYGKVYYFNNDHFDKTNPETAMTLLENGFTDFIAHLT